MIDPLAVGSVLYDRPDFKTGNLQETEELLWLLGTKGVRQFKELLPQKREANSFAMEAGGIYVMRSSGPASYQLVVDAGPHGAAGNNPRYGGDQVDFVQDLLNHARAAGQRRIEVPAEDERAWMDMIRKLEAYSPFEKRGQYYGGNTPGKPRAYLLNPGGRPKLEEFMARAAESGYAGFLGAGGGAGAA